VGTNYRAFCYHPELKPAPATGNPLTLYDFDQDRIIDGWTLTEPTTPQGALTPATVTNDSQFSAAIAAGSRYITVTTGTVLGTFNFNGTGNDIEIELQGTASIKWLKCQGTGGARWRFRGGTIGKLEIINRTDWIFDGVIINPNSTWASGLATGDPDNAVYVYNSSKIAFLNCVGVAYTTGTDGPSSTGHGNIFYITYGSNNLLFAGCNWASKPSGGGSNNNWAFRFSLEATGAPSMYNFLFVDCITRQTCQAIRFSGEIANTGLLEEKFHFDNCTIVNIDQCNNAIHSQDTRGLATDKICTRSCTFYLGDGGAGTQSLSQFGPIPAQWTSAGIDTKWYNLDSTFIVSSLSLASNTHLATIESNCASNTSFGVSDTRLRAKASNYSATDGAAFTVDANVHLLWPATVGGSATTGLWQTVHSPLTGNDVGDNPLKLAA
jgi:hypothetical protein